MCVCVCVCMNPSKSSHVAFVYFYQSFAHSRIQFCGIIGKRVWCFHWIWVTHFLAFEWTIKYHKDFSSLHFTWPRFSSSSNFSFDDYNIPSEAFLTTCYDRWRSNFQFNTRRKSSLQQKGKMLLSYFCLHLQDIRRQIRRKVFSFISTTQDTPCYSKVCEYSLYFRVLMSLKIN